MEPWVLLVLNGMEDSGGSVWLLELNNSSTCATISVLAWALRMPVTMLPCGSSWWMMMPCMLAGMPVGDISYWVMMSAVVDVYGAKLVLGSCGLWSTMVHLTCKRLVLA